MTQERLSTLRALNAMARERGQTLAQMALAWLYQQPGVTSVLIGASRSAQILENLAMQQSAPFTQAELAQIDSLTKPI